MSTDKPIGPYTTRMLTPREAFDLYVPAELHDAMERVKIGRTDPDKPNRLGCRFPHCACNMPWQRCGDERG